IGDFYTGNQLLTFKNLLTNSEYFETVDVEVARSSPGDDLLMPVSVTLEPRKQDKYSAGIGYGTDTGARGSLEWKRRYINRDGHQFSAKAEWSEIRRSVTSLYSIPHGQTVDNFFALKAGYKDEHTDITESETFWVGISKHHSRTLFDFKLSEVIGIEYRDEKYAIGSDTGHAKLLMPNINWSYVKADNRIYTLRGYKIELGVRGALNNFGSNASFLQSRLNAKFIRQLFRKGRIIARGEFGYSTIALLEGEFNDLPPSIRFFAGGDRSVRGYDYQTLAPKNFEGQVIGGKNLLVGSLEYEHKILEKWSLAVFYDVGNAFNDFTETLKHGTGVGVRWLSPVGLIRIDVATALSEEGTPLRLHITIGPDL
ncbi:BamA/TamA family outer membrane protein, partial [Candidatus Marithioploca araucensis]|nr:BamA/TamA family outer membrane protein [Candidatus Marithioploca araucensis]